MADDPVAFMNAAGGTAPEPPTTGPLDDAFWALVDRHIADGTISTSRHPELDLHIYCYGRTTQYTYGWDVATRTCRGLIATGDREVVARPPAKFHNVEEWPDGIPDADWQVFDKVDGSLLVVARHAGELICATKGSFTTEQADAGRRMLEGLYDPDGIDDGLTYCFEVIYPANRIVIDYDGARKLVLLTVIDTATGVDLAWDEVEAAAARIGCETVTRYRELEQATPAELKALNADGREGFVLFDPATSTRVKVKFDWYVAEHRLRTSVPTLRIIWDHLRHAGTVGELLEAIPDEFDGWVTSQARELLDRYEATVVQAETLFADHVDPDAERHVQATQAARAVAGLPKSDAKVLRGLVFALCDGHDLRVTVLDRKGEPLQPAKGIWNHIQPPAHVKATGDDPLAFEPDADVA